MKEKMEELYEKYLEQKLALIFSFHSAKKENKSNVKTIEKNGKYNIIDENGKILSPIWFDIINEFDKGYARVIITTKAMDKHGKVVIKDKMNIIDTSGKLVSDKWYDVVNGYFHNGFMEVENNGKANLIDENGNLISDEWYDRVDGLKNGIAMVGIKAPHYEEGFGMMPYKFDAIDIRGKRIFGSWAKHLIEDKKINNSFVLVYRWENEHINRIICTTVNLKDYKVKRFLTGYSCTNGNDKFNIKYEPLLIYDTRNVLCSDKQNVYLFDRSLGKYTKLGSIPYIEFNDNYIFDLENNKVYLVYEGLVHDITKYYSKNIKGKENVTINKGIPILSKDEFFIKQEEKIKKEAEKAKKEKELAEIRARQTEEERTLYDHQEKDEKKKKEEEIRLNEAVRSIMQGVKVLEQYGQADKKIERIQVANLFITAGDHKEINPLYVETGLLKYIDLSMISFANVKISGIDFRGCNIALKPQEVYGKDLSECNFEKLFISPFMDFNGVDIRGTRFSSDEDIKTLDLENVTFQNAIYDETTTYNGIPLTMIYSREEHIHKR